MRKDGVRIAIPNPHSGVIGIGLLTRILREAQIPREAWESV
jgi:hypothetical protein